MPYEKEAGAEVPAAVVTVTGTEPAVPGSGGTVTVHVVWSAQEVGAAWPSTSATMVPSALRNPDPVTVTEVPGPPVVGDREVIAGDPLAAGDDEVVVDVAPAPGLALAGRALELGAFVVVVG